MYIYKLLFFYFFYIWTYNVIKQRDILLPFSIYIYIYISASISLFNGISTFPANLIPKPFW